MVTSREDADEQSSLSMENFLALAIGHYLRGELFKPWARPQKKDILLPQQQD